MSAVATLAGGACWSTSVGHFHTPKLQPPTPLNKATTTISLPTSAIRTRASSFLFTPISARASHFRTAVAAADSDTAAAETDTDTKGAEKKRKRYHFVVANAKFMLDEEEHFKELLFERLRLFGERAMEQDFWLVVEPKFLENFPKITARLRRPAVALVSTNASWITFMKLRLDRVLEESFEADSVEEALASNPTEIKFEKPDNWVAPYTKYEYGWWEAFLPPGSKEEAKV